MQQPLLIKLRRATASVGLLVAAGAFLFHFGPGASPASADIFSPLLRSAGFVLPASGAKARVGQVLVNGGVFDYVLGHTSLPLHTVLDHYQRQFEVRDPASGRVIAGATRVDGDGSGVVTGARMRAGRDPGQWANRLELMATSFRLAELARFHLISAYSQPGGTVFIDFSTGADLRLDQLLPPTGHDAPGQDVTGVRRPGGLQRVMTIEHGEGSELSRTIIYRAADGRLAADAFGRAFAAAGWTANESTAATGFAHYSDGRRECFVAGTGGPGHATVILVHRSLS